MADDREKHFFGLGFGSGTFNDSDFSDGLRVERVADTLDFIDKVDPNRRQSESARLQDYSHHHSDRQTARIDMFSEDFLLDSIAVQFHSEVFWLQFVAHLFFPLAFFWLNYKAQGFTLDPRDPGFYINVFTPTIAYMMMASFMLCSDADKVITSGGVWVPLIYFIQHKLTVALKYASLSNTEYQKFQQNKSLPLASEYNKQLMLLQGWFNRDEQLLDFELGCAAARIGAKINEIFIHIPSPAASHDAFKEFANWNALLNNSKTVQLSGIAIPESCTVRELFSHAPCLVPLVDGSYQISVCDLCRAIVHKADATVTERGEFIPLGFLGLMLVVSWVKFLQNIATIEERTMMYYVFLVTSTVTLMGWGRVIVRLLYIAVWDVNRGLSMVKYLHRMIRLTDLTLDTGVSLSKASHTDRSRELTREKIGVILSIGEPESIKSRTLGNNLIRQRTLAQKLSESTKMSGLSEKIRDKEGERDKARESNENVNENVFNHKGDVKSADLHRRFEEFGSKSIREYDESHIPQVSLRYSQNIISWTYTRLVFQHFGERFRNRMDTYMVGTMLLMVLLVLYELLLVFIQGKAVFESAFFHAESAGRYGHLAVSYCLWVARIFGQ
mmetsp:Transcript_18139/g.40981  ORF Transcript_18139/g.40981 Transcript_18139/m.40981 type:complete len:613 (-) Transcript_18139:399-2237(-)